MLSLLIPTYNYNIYPLAIAIVGQCQAEGILFEVLCADDGSHSAHNTENEKINSLQNAKFRALPKNTGRSAMRNMLADKAQYNWLLFLDADVLPVDSHLVNRYLPHCDGNAKVVYGGIRYHQEKPATTELLRWVYGNEREALPAAERQEQPYLRLLTLNFMVHKNIFAKVRFNENIPNMRHEDTLFSYDLMAAGIPVQHIENNVYHLGLDDSKIFLKKSEEATEGLLHLLEQKLLPVDYTQFGKFYFKIMSLGLTGAVASLFLVLRKAMQQNLCGGNPSLRVFDFYRIGYICLLKKK